MAAGSRAADYGKMPLLEHMAQSNREILLACMIEDMAAVERIDEIAAVEGSICWRSGRPTCRARSGSAATPDHPRLVAAIDRVREAVKKGAGCRLALPLNHAAFPRNAAQLKELGAGYTNCAPTPESAPACARCERRRRSSANCWADRQNGAPGWPARFPCQQGMFANAPIFPCYCKQLQEISRAKQGTRRSRTMNSNAAAEKMRESSLQIISLPVHQSDPPSQTADNAMRLRQFCRRVARTCPRVRPAGQLSFAPPATISPNDFRLRQ